MSLPAEQAVRAWCNANLALVGNGQPVSGGFYLRQQRSPASGQYAVLSRESTASPDVVAENDGNIDQARLTFLFYGGTEETAEAAAVAWASEVQSFSGLPAACGDTGVLLLATDNVSGPMHVSVPAEGGEIWAYEAAADFLLAAA